MRSVLVLVAVTKPSKGYTDVFTQKMDCAVLDGKNWRDIVLLSTLYWGVFGTVPEKQKEVKKRREWKVEIAEEKD